MNEWKIEMKSLGFFAMCLIWGTTWMAIKIGLEDMTPFFSLGLRYLIAGFILVLYGLLSGMKLGVESCPTWVLPNGDGSGYFRFALSESGWEALAGAANGLEAAQALAYTDSLDAAFR